MALIKVAKKKAYYKRYQVKNRRRREGKTDYYARRRLIIQDKNKYNSPKYRFVVRFTNTDIVCQITYAKVEGDVILAAAYAHELPRYGVKLGLTNYAASYATGLLCARRLLQKLGLDKKYVGQENPNGELFEVEHLDDGPRPFKAFLDVGLVRTSTGHRVFAALKGAADGGIEIPHNEKRLIGYNKDTKKYDPEIMRKYIYGGNIADYMRTLEEDDQEAYQRQFSRFIAAGIKADDLEAIYRKAHAQIRADPSFKPKVHANLKQVAEASKKHKQSKKTLKERRHRVQQLKDSFFAAQEIAV